LSGGQGVVGSNPIVPTNLIKDLQNHQNTKVEIYGFRDNSRDNKSQRSPRIHTKKQAATVAGLIAL
jgi:hypothetical protein